MYRFALAWLWVVFFHILIVSSTHASKESTGSHGIYSSDLGLTGSGINIGQVEKSRPYKPGLDDPLNVNDSIDPEQVYFQDALATANQNVFPFHATTVAGVMISTHTTPGSDPASTGVATGADLYASDTGEGAFVTQSDAELTFNHIATINDSGLPSNDSIDDVRAINSSYGFDLGAGSKGDGNSQLSLFVDWSAKKHDVLYVTSGGEFSFTTHFSPSDNFNGLTVAASTKDEGVYAKVAGFNNQNLDADGDRTSIDLLAPGEDVYMTSVGNLPVPNDENDGTSYAAPHVTGTVALLQEYGDAQIAAAAPNWGVNARRHEVMKAVLMNSADKIEDTSGTGKYLGMDRTVLKTTETEGVLDDWFDSDAYSIYPPLSLDTEIPLDEEMGAGHLNAKRALQQFIPGEQEVNGHYGAPPVGDVPVIGWDYGTIEGANWPINKYALDETLEAGNFISITLAWDRVVAFANDADMDGEYDIGLSNSFVTPVEHIFVFNKNVLGC